MYFCAYVRPFIHCERKFYLRTHVKITRQWKSISFVLGLRKWHDALRSLVRIARFLPASCPVQRSSVEVTSKFRPSHFPWWRLTSIDLQCEYSGILFLSPQQRKQRRVTSAAGFVRKYIPINFKINIKSAYYKNP